jgi:predicted nucleic acid-binding protein
VTLSDEIAQIDTIFIDTAPIIYYIEAHPKFGPLSKEIIDALQSGKLTAYSSVITLTEVMPKPIQKGQNELASKFTEFLINGKNLYLLEISEDIALEAGRLRGKYPGLRALDAVQLSTAISVEADGFLTNDNKLKQIKEIKILLLGDFL